MMSSAISEQADKLKEEGNALFKNGKYLEAFMKYNQAYTKLSTIDAANEDEERVNITYKQAVLLSNRSNCLFELGKYDKSKDDSRKCISFLGGIPEESAIFTQSRSLEWKNLLRIARCGIYSGNIGGGESSTYEEDIAGPLQTLEECGDAAYEKRAKRMLSQVISRRQSILEQEGAKGSPPPLSPIHRASLFGSWMCEYYNYGHDIVTSALESGFLDDDNQPACPAIELAKLPDEHLSNLSLLFGGVGDARHVYTTLCDVNKQYNGLSNAKKKKFRVNMLLNDINATALTRDILIIAALVRLGGVASSHEACGDSGSEAFRLATAVQYLFFGYTYPKTVHETVVSLVDDLLKDGFSSLKMFIFASDNDWLRVKDVMQYWLNAEEGVDFFPTTTTVLEEIFRARSDNCNMEEECIESGMGMMTDTARAHLNSTKDRNRTKKEERLAEIDGLTLDSFGAPEELEMYRSQLPASERNNDAKLLKVLKSYARTALESQAPEELQEYENGGDSPGRFLDKQFLFETNAILPPVGCAGELYDRIWRVEHNVRKCKALINKAKQDVKSSWKVNRTMFDPNWTKHREGLFDANKFNPVADIGSSFLHAYGVLDYCGSSPHDILQMNFFQCTSLFFWNTSRALVNLIAAGSLRIELNLGSVTDLCRSIQGKHSGLKFHRILISNIADYIGMISVFTEIAPLLHPPTKNIPTFIQTNVLFNTQLWQSYSHYIYSGSGIPTTSNAYKLVGLQYMNPDSVWIHQNQWTLGTSHSMKGTASRDELTQWLHRLLLFSLLPPKRNSDDASNESCPMNVSSFMRVCAFCVEVLGYPTHWIGQVLDEIITACSTGVLKAKAEVPMSSPVTYCASSKLNNVDIRPFRLELMTQIGIWMSHYEKCLMPLANISRGSCRKYWLVLWSKSDGPCLEVKPIGEVGCGGNFAPMCLGFVLSKLKDPDGAYDNAPKEPNPFEDILPRSPEFGYGKIRTSAVQGDSTIHLFSCMRFDRDEATNKFFIEFYMKEDDFQQYSSYFIYPFRTDR